VVVVVCVCEVVSICSCEVVARWSARSWTCGMRRFSIHVGLGVGLGLGVDCRREEALPR